MTSYFVILLPPRSNEISQDKINGFVDIISGKAISDPPVCFQKDDKKPRYGFEPESVCITDYGLKAKFAYEEKIMIPTADGDILEFKKTSVGGKLIKKQGILLIDASTDSIAKKVTKKWLETLFLERLIPINFLKISQNDLETFVTNHARTVIAISHSEVKGLQTIRMHAYDLPNKTWYKEEGFDSTTASQVTFVPKLTGEISKKTPICRLYRNGKIVIYHNSKFSDDEYEQIELQLIDMLAQVLGSPLCKRGPKSSQGKIIPG